jgi:hypothetical protein
MANTFELIASSTVGSGGASSIAFSSIASTYTDLCLKVSSRGALTGTLVMVTFNGSGSGYKATWLDGDGSAASSGTNSTTLQNLMAWTQSSSTTANTFGNFEMYIPNYAGSNYKTISTDYVNENNATGGIAYGLLSNNWSNTAAITSISLAIYGGTNFAQYSTAYLYGIKNS